MNNTTEINFEINKQHILFASLVLLCSLSAMAGTDLSLDGAVDWLLNLMQGGLGKIIALGTILLTAIAWAAANWKYGLGVLGVIFALVVLPPFIIAIFPATIEPHPGILNDGFAAFNLK